MARQRSKAANDDVIQKYDSWHPLSHVLTQHLDKVSWGGSSVVNLLKTIRQEDLKFEASL